MPELPEVETVKETLNQLVTGKMIKQVQVRWPNIIKRPNSVETFKEMLRGQAIHRLSRRGKFLLFHLDDDVLVSHLRMEGKYRLAADDAPIDKHTHVIFQFTDGTALFYRDVRKFGTMHLFKKGEERLNLPLVKLGPEPLENDFTEEKLAAVCRKTARAIKPLLLDQTAVAGLGNIYTDEVLFSARIHPLTTARTLSDESLHKLHLAIRETLSEAVRLGGSTVRSYLNSQGQMGMFQQKLNVYGRDGEPCIRCGTKIEKIKVGGRGTHFCPSCQRRNNPC